MIFNDRAIVLQLYIVCESHSESQCCLIPVFLYIKIVNISFCRMIGLCLGKAYRDMAMYSFANLASSQLK